MEWGAGGSGTQGQKGVFPYSLLPPVLPSTPSQISSKESNLPLSEDKSSFLIGSQ